MCFGNETFYEFGRKLSTKTYGATSKKTVVLLTYVLRKSSIKICLLLADIRTDCLVDIPLVQDLLFNSDSSALKFV